MSHHLVNLISIPLFTGAIGYLTNWSGVWMLFSPVHFKGWRVPGLAALAEVLPRKIQQIPGIANGGIGWQGIIPSRAAKMGSIAVDKGIAKVGSASDFYEQLGPERIAEHILQTARGDIRDMVERTMQRDHPDLWNDLPPRLRERIHARVEEQLLVGGRSAGGAEWDALHAPREALDHREELERAERLPQIRVGPHGLGGLLGLAVGAREEDDGDVGGRRVALQLSAERQPVDDGHADVEHDRVGVRLAEARLRLRGALRLRHLDVDHLERRPKERPEPWIVVYQQ